MRLSSLFIRCFPNRFRRRRWCLALLLTAFALIWLILQTTSLETPKVAEMFQYYDDNEPHQERRVPNYPAGGGQVPQPEPMTRILPNGGVVVVPQNHPQLLQPQFRHGGPGIGGLMAPTAKLPKSVTDNIAILVIDDGSKVAQNFIDTARANFQLISTPGNSQQIFHQRLIVPTNNDNNGTITMTAPITTQKIVTKKVTFFLFSAEGYQVPSSDDVVKIAFQPEISFSKTRNPCQVYLQFSEKFGYFDEAKFDHVLSFDARMRVMMPINLHDEMLTELLAVTHPGFFTFIGRDPRLLPYDRRNNSCAFVPAFNETQNGYFSGNLFGGETGEFSQMCRTIVSKCSSTKSEDEAPEFHQLVNFYFARHKQPTRTLSPSFCYATGIGELPFYPQKIHLNERLPDDPNLSLEMADEAFFARREQQIQRIVVDLKQKFMTKMAERIAQPHAFRIQFLAYRCDPGVKCGSFGGRFRGAASLLFLAIASERIYNLQWVDPLDVGEHFFAVNERWYNVTETQFNSELMQSSYKPNYIFASDTDFYQITSKLNTWKMNELRRKTDVLLVTTNVGKMMLENLFRIPSFYPAFHAVIPNMPEFKINVNYGIYLSAAMRVVFGEKTDRFKKLIEAAISSEPNWENSVKIGIQIRTCQKPGQNCQQILPRYRLECFAEKAIEIIKTKLPNTPKERLPIIVLVTSDLDGDGRAEIVDIIRQVFNTRKLSNNVNIVEKSGILAKNGDYPIEDVQWRETATALLEWHLLTLADWLVITSSGFGETASIYSMRPTYRLADFGVDCQFSWYNADIAKTDRF